MLGSLLRSSLHTERIVVFERLLNFTDRVASAVMHRDIVVSLEVIVGTLHTEGWYRS